MVIIMYGPQVLLDGVMLFVLKNEPKSDGEKRG